MLKLATGIIFPQVTLLIALTTSHATFDVEGLKAKAATNLQILTEVAATNLHSFSEKASGKLQTLQEKAASKLQELTENASNNLHEIADSIDLEKLKKLDFLQILPRVHDRLLVKTVPAKEKIKYLNVKHFNGKHPSAVKGLNLKGENLKMAFEGKYPWPVVTRRIEYIYE